MQDHAGCTLAEIGKALGVSTMTVSRALNDRQGISPTTLCRIKAYARKAGYRPNQVARSLASGKTLLLGAILRNIGHPQTALVVQGIEEEAVQEGYGLLLYITQGEVELERRHLEAVSAKRVDGLLLYPTDLGWRGPDPNRQAIKAVQALGIPVLALMRPLRGARVPALFPDWRGAAALAARHLHALGHRRILYLTITTRTCFQVCEHVAGLAQTLDALGSRFDPRSDVVGDEFGSFAAFREKVAAGKHTAAVCYSDDLAFGALVTLRRMGITVPRAMSLVGMNDDPIAARCEVPLTTVALPFRELGRSAARALLAWEAAAPDGVRHMEGRLVIRASTGPVRAP